MMVVVGSNVGYRITELLTWTLGHVLTREREIAHEVTVTRALLKRGSGVRKRSVRSRWVVLNERARGAIRDYLASLGRVPAPQEYLFKSRQGWNRPLHRAQAHDILKAAYRACGIDEKHISTHSLRKNFVQAVYDASGHDLICTQRIVGHSSPVVTAHCLESAQDVLDELVLGLPAAAPKPALGLAS